MGESGSSVDAPNANNPMGDSEQTGVTELDVSISFGRFENDVLAWEKWSTFPTNKYLEEVEKFSTPGSVAQKKAYFEAHYKKIADRKDEQEDQDRKIMEDSAREPVNSEVQAHRDLESKFCEAEEKVIELDSETEMANSESEMSSDQQDETNVANGSEDLILPIVAENLSEQKSVCGSDLENEVGDFGNDMRSDQVDEPKNSLVMANESKDLILMLDAKELNEQKSVSGIEVENEVSGSGNETSYEADECTNMLDKVSESSDLLPLIDEAALLKDDAPSQESEKVEELPQHIDNVRDNAIVIKGEKVKSENMLKSKKVTTTKKVTSMPLLKKKPVASTPKSFILSNNKLSRSALSKSIMSESRGSSKKEYVASPLIHRKPSRIETRKQDPTSLHTSLNLCPDHPVNSEAAPIPPSTTLRKSVFMEKMGDKDIVKRAFKAFRNDLNQLSSSSPDKPTLASQFPRKETGIKASVAGTPRKNIEGVHNVVKKIPQSSEPGLRKSSNSTRLPHVAVGGDRSNENSVSSNYGSRSFNKLEKNKEYSKKPAEKAIGKAADRTQLHSKVKEMEIKRLSRDDHYTKAKSLVGTAKPKSTLDKKITK